MEFFKTCQKIRVMAETKMIITLDFIIIFSLLLFKMLMLRNFQKLEGNFQKLFKKINDQPQECLKERKKEVWQR